MPAFPQPSEPAALLPPAAATRDPAPLDCASIVVALADRARWRVDVVAATGSTNADLVAVIRRDGALPSARILAAERQDAGRGRLGRPWDATPGRSLTVSFAVPVPRAMNALAGVTLVCGLAVRDALATVGVDAGLKWPNDVVVAGCKLAGILVEAQPLATGTALVVGVGVNVLPVAPGTDPQGLGRVSLSGAGATRLDRDALVAAIADALAGRLDRFAVAGFAPFVADWNAADAFADRPVTIAAGAAAPLHGVARGVDDDGALRLDVDGVVTRIVGGDVSLRPDPR